MLLLTLSSVVCFSNIFCLDLSYILQNLSFVSCFLPIITTLNNYLNSIKCIQKTLSLVSVRMYDYSVLMKSISPFFFSFLLFYIKNIFYYYYHNNSSWLIFYCNVSKCKIKSNKKLWRVYSWNIIIILQVVLQQEKTYIASICGCGMKKGAPLLVILINFTFNFYSRQYDACSLIVFALPINDDAYN